MELATEAFLYWLGAAERRPSTTRCYKSALDRLSRMGLDRLEKVTRSNVVGAQRALLARGWKATTVRTEFTALRAILKTLARDGLFSKAVLAELREAAVELPDRGRRRRVRHLTLSEFEHLATTAARVSPHMELPIRLAVWSGVRIGELARLRAEDVKGGHFWVESLPEYGEAGACKTGPRSVPICRELAQVFERLPRSGWVFPARTGSRTPFVSRWSLQNGMRRVRAAAGFGSDVVFLTLRHTRASWWLQGGVSIYKVADYMGHDVATCEEFYGSLKDGYDPDCERRPAA